MLPKPRLHPPRSLPPRCLLLFAGLSLVGCWTPDNSKQSADGQAYAILSRTNEVVSGESTTWKLERPVDTLRTQLIDHNGVLPDGSAVRLSLAQALDIAAENSREFQRQKEVLYLAALNLTRLQWDFAVRFGGGPGGQIRGIADQSADLSLNNNLSASVRSPAGTRIVASFVNTFLRSVVGGRGFDGSSILNLTLTQPLLEGSGSRIVREPLTQAERDVVYAVRSFERFRGDFAISLASDYWNLCSQQNDLTNVEANYQSLVQSRIQIEALYNAGRRTVTDMGRAKQSEFTADANRVNARNRLETALDRFKLRLGLPTTSELEVDPTELDRLKDLGVSTIDLGEDAAIELALARRYDYRTTVDEVEDAGRRIFISEDALRTILDFTAALNVPAESGRGLDLDWSRINWSAGFDVGLALDRLLERNAYRSALINFDVAIRAREQAQDSIAANVRAALRNIQAALESYNIQKRAVELAQQRVEATTDLYAAGRVQALEKLDAQDALLRSQLDVNAAIVSYSVARLQLLNELQGIVLQPAGLQFDRTLPIPHPTTAE